MAKRIFSTLGESFKIIFKNWRIFLPLFATALIVGLLALGASEDTWVLTGVLMFLMLWLTTLFAVRHLKAGHKINFRDCLYNAFTPLVPTLLIFVVMLVQCLPFILAAIAYSAALETELFARPFYGTLLVIFVLAMLGLSLYLLSGTLMSLIAVTVPSTYPLEALKATHQVMKGKRAGLILRILLVASVLALISVPTIGILILIANVTNTILLPGGIYAISCFATIFTATYFYLYYRELIGYKEQKNAKKRS